MALYGEALRNNLLEELRTTQRALADLQARVDSCELDYTDCFRSLNMYKANIECIQLQLHILDGKGTRSFIEVRDRTTKEVFRSRTVNTKYGLKILVEHPSGPIFVKNVGPRCLTKHNLEKCYVDAPVWVKLVGDDLGHSYPTVYRAKINRVTGKEDSSF